MNKKLLLTVLFFIPFMRTITAQDVSDIRVRLENELLIVTYNLSERADIEAYVSLDGAKTWIGPLQHVTGAVGKNISEGKDKIFLWDAAKEVGYIEVSNAIIKIVTITEDLPKIEEPQPIPIVQGYKPFRVDMGVGLTISQKFDPLPLEAYIEPKYAPTPNFSIGLKAAYKNNYNYEKFVIFSYEDIHMDTVVSYNFYSIFATFDIHFYPTQSCRPFIGIGGGLYIIQSDEFDRYRLESASAKVFAQNFGLTARAGFDLPHFRIALNANYAGRYKHLDNTITPFWLGATAAVYFGGGKK
jgi:hypothetical protein